MSIIEPLRRRKRNRELCKSWQRFPVQHLQVNHHVRPVTVTLDELLTQSRRGIPSWPGTLHYESGETGAPGIHFDLNYTPSSPVTNPATVHTLLSISVTCDVGSPYTRMVIRRADRTEWDSPVIPPGTGTFNQAQINAQGFTVLEDCAAFTAMT